MKTIEVAMIGICAALYAVIGRLTDFGLVTPTAGVVAFWPAAVIPAVIAVIYGPWTGGFGAAIGIFIRDMLFHGNPFVSATAGVTSNFAMFFLIGYISRRQLNWQKIVAGVFVGSAVVGLSASVPLLMFPSDAALSPTQLTPFDSMLLFVGVSASSLILIGLVSYLWPEWKNYTIASVVGLGVGSTIIGFALYSYSQFLPLPGGLVGAPTYFILVWIIWTFATEIPFLIVIGPPILKAIYRAFPSLKPRIEESK
ncbi:MAG TPA: ECF transporter S component [Candidatus Krumholzibacteriaceae bacterium]|nr:ECF transporter S component [Candidatus Krumholzibacteriaceae bacterium]